MVRKIYELKIAAYLIKHGGVSQAALSISPRIGFGHAEVEFRLVGSEDERPYRRKNHVRRGL
jgi:hypothetical protein